jgi:hypothetical protein
MKGKYVRLSQGIPGQLIFGPISFMPRVLSVKAAMGRFSFLRRAR